MLGVLMFFDGALLALGNVRSICTLIRRRSSGLTGTCILAPQILFLCGLTLIIGMQKTFYFFARKQKIRGTLCFLGGVLLVFFKWPFIGFIVEIFGFLNLFGYALEAMVLNPTLGTHQTFVVQRFLPGDPDLPATTPIHRNVLNASLRPRRVYSGHILAFGRLTLLVLWI